MKIFKALILFIIISLSLSACSSPNTDSSDKIVPPRNKLIQIEGTWEISDVLVTAPSEQEESKQWIGMKVQFTDDYMSLGDIILENPEYQMKRVNAEEYSLYNSKSLPTDFVFPSKEIEVITVIDGDNFFCETLVLKENELVLKIQGNSFYLNKLSSEVDEYKVSKAESEDNQGTNMQTNQQDVASTGVLIGLRSLNENLNSKSEGEYSYRTLWISSKDNELKPILEINSIFFPRRSGFWKIEMKKVTKGNRSGEYVLANNVSMEDKIAEIELNNKIAGDKKLPIEKNNGNIEIDFSSWGDRIGEFKRRINYISNDYISVETTGKGGYTRGDKTWEKSKLQIIPIDSLPNGRSIKISDILGEPGIISMKSAWERSLGYFKIENQNILYREELLENFGIERKLGHWFLKGRINYIKDQKFKMTDYSINLIPPTEVVSYDTLTVPWMNVKDIEPRAIDVYTSPNKDIAIVITRSELLIYDINHSRLSRYPMERIDLKQGETVIMAEWATGKYTENWDSTFQKSGGQLLE